MDSLIKFDNKIRRLIKIRFPSISIENYGGSSRQVFFPGRGNLWDTFFLSVLNEFEVRYLKIVILDWNKEVERFSVMPEYVSLSDIQQELERSFFSLLSWERQQELITLIYEFHFIVNDWFRKNWHTKCLEGDLDVVRQLSEKLGVNQWIMAGVLQKLGYPFLSSKLAMDTWLRWSGVNETISYRKWAFLLSSNLDNPYLFDHWFCLISSMNNAEESTCISKACVICELGDECKTGEEQVKVVYEKVYYQALSGDLKDLSDQELVLFLGDPFLTPYIKEKGFLENHQANFESYYQNVVIQKDSEQWIVFWKVVKEYFDRIKIKDSPQKGRIFKCSGDIFETLVEKVSGEKREAFYALILDNKHRMIQLHMVSKGTLNQSLVHPREVFSPAIQLRAAALILIHNHPSGDPEPSSQDFEVTKRLVSSGKTLGIHVLDHIIFGEAAYYSFVDEGVMPT